MGEGGEGACRCLREPPQSPVGTARPRRPRKRKSRLVMAHRDRGTSGICLKSIKENHDFLEENPLVIKARRRHPSAANRRLIQNSCTETTIALTDEVGPRCSSADGTGPWLCSVIANRQQWVWVSGPSLTSKISEPAPSCWTTAGKLRAVGARECCAGSTASPVTFVPLSASWHIWLGTDILAGCVSPSLVIFFQYLRPHHCQPETFRPF